MNIYIDASGNPGEFKEESISSLYVMGVVYIADKETEVVLAEGHGQYLPKLNHRLGEYKSSIECSANNSFIEHMLVNGDWCFGTAIGDRIDFKDYGLRYSKSCIKWFTRKALSMVPTALRSGSIEIDTTGSEITDEELLLYLRKNLVNKKWEAINNMKCLESVNSPGIQLADLLAGRVRKFLHYGSVGENTSRRYERAYMNIAEREINQWMFSLKTLEKYT
jgi:hypothetical protein